MSKRRDKKSTFRGRVASSAKKTMSESTGNRDYLILPKNIHLFEIKENTRKINLDFLPYEVTSANHPDGEDAPKGSLWYRRPFLLHRGVGSNNASYICRKSVKKKCPICDFQKELFEKDREGAISLYPKERMLYVVMVLNSEDHDEENPYIWDISVKLFSEELAETLEEDWDNETFMDLEEGKTLKISLKWKSIGEKGRPFAETRSITFENRDAYDESILDEIPSLDEIIENSILSYEELSKRFMEVNDEDEDDDSDENEKPAKRKERKKKIIEESDEEDENEDRPKKSTKKRTRKIIDESPGEKDDLDEDEKPKKRRTDKKSKNTKCPFGYAFGKDHQEYDECDECELWNECDEESERLEND